MTAALRNFAAITLIVLLCVLSAWVYFRGRALSEAPKRPFDHPFLVRLTNGPKPVAYQGFSAKYPPNTLLAFQKAVELGGPDLILWADVRPTLDGTMVVLANRDLSSQTESKEWVGYVSDTEIAKLDAGYRFTLDAGQSFPFRGQGLKVLKLKELLEAFPSNPFILNFHEYKGGMDRTIAALMEETKASERVLITSTEDGILKDLREQNPSWIFGTSQAQGTRLQMFASVGLEATIPLHGDVFMAVSTDGPRHIQLTDRILSEVRRRNLKVIAGPYDNFAEASKNSAALNADALLLRDPSALFDQATH